MDYYKVYISGVQGCFKGVSSTSEYNPQRPHPRWDTCARHFLLLRDSDEEETPNKGIEPYKLCFVLLMQ